VSLPAWLDPLPGAAEQRAADEWAIGELGIPGVELMERAGRGLAEAVAQSVPTGRIAIVAGRGNNGGDGLVAARLLRELGREVTVLALADPSEWRGDAAANLERLVGEAPASFSPQALAGAAGIVDAMLGTGFAGAPREPVAGAIAAVEAAREAGATVVACDVPSGVDASTGEAPAGAVSADRTVTFAAAKPGLWISPGKRHAGAVTVVDIGIPAGAPGEASVGLITPRVLDLVPRRGPASNKFTAGSVLVCGGSAGLSGAPALASLAAARAGAGYVTAAIPASLDPILSARLLEVMTLPLPESDGALAPESARPVLERSEREDALVLGPGIGRSDGAVELARELAARARLPLVLDADGLGAHAGRLAPLADREAPTVLTPHEGELARLLGVGAGEVGARRLELARAAAAQAAAIVVLKGDDTLVADPGGRVAVSPGGAPALATAGTGDVLSGTIAALLAKRLGAWEAACAGVLAHLRAGRLAAEPSGPDGVLASDVAARLAAGLSR